MAKGNVPLFNSDTNFPLNIYSFKAYLRDFLFKKILFHPPLLKMQVSHAGFLDFLESQN